jgi:beta-lactamase class A
LILMRFRTAILLLASTAAAAAQPMAEAVRARIGDFPGAVSLYAKNLDTGATFGIREAEPVRTASTIKLAILCSVFDTVARGQAKWTDPLPVTAAQKVSGSGVIGTELSTGVELPLADVAHLMIVLSDNTATNMILERFGADSVNAYLDRIGIKTTRSLRKIRGDGSQLKNPEGWSAAGKLEENKKYGIGVSTPRDMVTILERLEKGEIVSPGASKEILAILKRCQDNTGIRRRAGDAQVANKTGALDALRSDVGIVYSKGGRIAMAITVDGIPKPDWSPDNPGLLMIADLSQMLVDGLAKR